MIKKNLIIIIPARSGSEGIKNKNFKKLNGKPLVSYSFEIAKKIKFTFDKDDGKQFFKFTENANYDIGIIERKAELVDYVQKTFEAMGIIN